MSFVPSTSLFDVRPNAAKEITQKNRIRGNLQSFKPMNTLEPPPPEPEEPPAKQVEIAPFQDPTSEEVKDTEDAKPRKKKNEGKFKVLKGGPNLQRLNLSKGKSFKNMGRTRNARNPKKQSQFIKYYGRNPNPEFDIPQYLVKPFNFETHLQNSQYELRKTEDDWLHELGYENWREGQQQAIQDIMSSRSTILILTTGAGKSLTFQILSMMLEGLVVVICPLVSLCIDHLSKLPTCIPGGMLHSQMEYNNQRSVLNAVHNGSIKLLFTTPERYFFDNLAEKTKLLVIDEVHWVSETSHSFRASYLKLRTIDHPLILGLTATATQTTVEHISSLLSIDNVVQGSELIRSNIDITVSTEGDLFRATHMLLMQEDWREGSILIFSAFKNTCEALCDWLKGLKHNVDVYNSSKKEYVREKAQLEFMSGKTRILICTTSFAMGVNKLDVRGVIHLHLPRSPEAYVQEAGRAGRDGHPARSHIFLSQRYFLQQRNRTYGEHMTAQSALLILKLLMIENKEMLPTKGLTERIGVEKDTIYRALFKLEEHGVIKLHGESSSSADIKFYKRTPEELAKKYEWTKALLACARSYSGTYKTNLIELAKKLDQPVNDTIRDLFKLQGLGEISLTLTDEAYHYTILSSTGIPTIAKYLEEAMNVYEDCDVRRLDSSHEIFWEHAEDDEFYVLLRGYFTGQEFAALECLNLDECAPGSTKTRREFLKSSVSHLASQEESLTDRDIACILMGINTFRTPYLRWKGNRVWGNYAQFDFKEVIKEANETLMDVYHEGIVIPTKRIKN